jgi:hypothetical protein
LTLDPDKDLNDEAQAEINSEYREFTDEEFARGDVAYWLNYTQKGYTGDYSGEWTQGADYPLLDLNKSASLVKIVYEIEGVVEEVNFNGSPYANVGSEVEVTYSEKPSTISIDGVEMSASEIGATSTKIIVPSVNLQDPVVKVKVVYNETSIAEGEKGDMATNIASDGNVITIYGAGGENVSVVSLRGVELVKDQIATDNFTIVIPQSGIYVVKVGDITKKVVVR